MLGESFAEVRLISIHALREEGDMDYSIHATNHGKFLSTPSAKRATSLCPR